MKRSFTGYHTVLQAESVWELTDMLFSRPSPLRGQTRVILLVLVKKLAHPSSVIVLGFAREIEYIYIHTHGGDGGGVLRNRLMQLWKPTYRKSIQ